MDKHAFLHSSMNRIGETGAALIVGLIFLVVLTMIGITAAKMAGLEERMSGNMRDRALAMQAAEMALRYAERDVLHSGRISVPNGLTPFNADCGVASPALDDFGLCWNGPGGYGNADPPWYKAMMDIPGAHVVYGNAPYLAAVPDILLVSQQPRYLIEVIDNTEGGPPNYYYRITVRAQGVYARTTVWLQEVFAP